jgi:tetratricopeptide (TPR) repeat protein
MPDQLHRQLGLRRRLLLQHERRLHGGEGQRRDMRHERRVLERQLRRRLLLQRRVHERVRPLQPCGDVGYVCGGGARQRSDRRRLWVLQLQRLGGRVPAADLHHQLELRHGHDLPERHLPDLPRQRRQLRVDDASDLLQRQLRELPMPMTRVLAALSFVLALAFAAPALAAEDASDDLRARTHFAAGEYKPALDIYVRLYAETLHPTYLRNIARCYQNLGQADKAISSFREYLRKAKELTPAARSEIEGYIAEMEQLKRSQSAPPPAPTAPAPAMPAPSASEPAPSASAPPPSSSEPPLVLVGPPTVVAQPRDEDPPFYTRAWFWGTVAGVAVGGVLAALLLSSGGDRPRGSLGALDLTDKN